MNNQERAKEFVDQVINEAGFENARTMIPRSYYPCTKEPYMLIGWLEDKNQEKVSGWWTNCEKMSEEEVERFNEEVQVYFQRRYLGIATE
jgi:hypothetical protein